MKQALTDIRHKSIEIDDQLYHPQQPSTIVHAHQAASKLQNEICIEMLPRSVHINSKKQDRSVTALKNKFRRNIIDRANYDPVFSSKSKMAREYFQGIDKLRDFGEDENGYERLEFNAGEVGFHNPTPNINVVAQNNRTNEIIDLEAYNRDDSIIYLA